MTRHGTVGALGLLVFAWVLGAAPAAAQGRESSARGTQPEFRAGVDLVALDVCVKDRDGRLIPGLAPEDFLVLEDGSPQQVTFFIPSGRVPLATVLLIDRSSSMYGSKLARAREAATTFVRSLSPGDLVGVVAFNERADRVVALSPDHHAAARAVAGMDGASGSTGLYEAVLLALSDLRRLREHAAREYRYAVIILSDGEDTTGRLAFDEVVRAVRRSDVIVYGVSVRSEERDRWVGAGYVLIQLAMDTGGRAVSAQGPASLAPIFEEISAELRHMYRLAYGPANETRDGRWREISVRVAPPDAQVRSRRGYYAPGTAAWERRRRAPSH